MYKSLFEISFSNGMSTRIIAITYPCHPIEKEMKFQKKELEKQFGPVATVKHLVLVKQAEYATERPFDTAVDC